MGNNWKAGEKLLEQLGIVGQAEENKLGENQGAHEPTWGQLENYICTTNTGQHQKHNR